MWTVYGAWPVLVKWGNLGVLPRVPVHGKGGKTAPLLRVNSSIPFVKIPVRSTSPKVPKSQNFGGCQDSGDFNKVELFESTGRGERDMRGDLSLQNMCMILVWSDLEA
jgi:hypothetical protein